MTTITNDPVIAAVADPFGLFDQWFKDAARSEPGLPEAMSLATSTRDGRPSLRMVLLKDVGADGFVFYTNSESRKGREIATNSEAAICLYWKSISRQIRAEGRLAVVDAETADAYFRTRPRASQLAAWASDQSQPIADRADLFTRYADVEKRFAGGDVPRPPHWLGYRLVPRVIEFWQDVANRMHDRVVYTRLDAGWRAERIAP